MNITVNSRGLQRVLGSVSKAIVPKPLVPAYEYFRMNAKDGILTILASDGNLYISDRCECSGEGECLIPAKTFAELINALPEIEVGITTGAESATIDWKKGHSTIPCQENVNEYPSVGDDAVKGEIKVSIPELVSAVGHVIDFTATDEFRPMFTGIFFDVQPFSTNLVATDGTILSQSPVGNGAECEPFILPGAIAKNVKSIRGADAVIYVGEKDIRIVTDTATFGARQVEGKFPPYQRLFPTSSTKVLEVSKESFLGSLKRVMICGNKDSKSLKLSVSSESASLFSEDLSFSTKAQEHLSDYTYSGDAINIGFNAELLRKALMAMQSDTIRISMTESNRGALVESESDLTRTVIMPIILK